MSKIANKPIIVTEGVHFNLDGQMVKVAGPLGEKTLKLPESLQALVSENKIMLKRKVDNRSSQALHGTYARLIKNLITGVSSGFEKTLEIVGTGYRGQMEGDTLVLSLGLSHQIKFPAPEGIKLSMQENKVKIFGADKEQVGTITHTIRMFRKPDPYKGKGIRYAGEKLRLKPGKAAAKTSGTAGK